jgi:hypothetical protein
MKKLAICGAAATCTAALCFTAAATAGPEARDASGNYAVLDAAFSPPASSTGKTVSAVNLLFNVSLGNKKTGAPFPSGPDFKLTLPKGTVFNGAELPQCPLPASPEEVGDQSRCGTLQRVGGGETVIDASALGATEPILASLTAYNGKKHNGHPTLLVFAEGTGAAEGIKAEIGLEWTKGGFAYFDTSGSAEDRAPYSFSSFDLGIGRIYKFKVKHRTVKVPLFEAPRKCSRSGWTFALNFTKPSAGLNLTARDASPCLRLVD